MFVDTLKHIFGRGSIIGINQLSVLISLPILASRLDLIIFGQIAIGFLMVQLSWVVSNWGVEQFSIEEWLKKKTLKQKNNFTSLVVSLNITISLLCLFIIFILTFFKIIDFSLLFFLSLIPSILMGGTYPLWFFQVQKSPHEMIFPTFASRLIFLLIIYFFVNGNDSAYLAFVAQGIGLSLITIFSFYKMVKKYNFIMMKFSFDELFLISKKSYPYLVNTITNNKINTLWSFGLSICGGPAAMATYNIGDQIYRAGSALTNIIAQSIRIYFMGKPIKDMQSIFIFFVSIFFMITLGVYFLSEYFVITFFPPNYLSAIPIIKIMIIAWGMHGAIKLLNYPVLGESFGAIWVNKITYTILIIHFIAFLIWNYFFEGAIMMSIIFASVVFSQLIFFIIFTCYAKKK